VDVIEVKRINSSNSKEENGSSVQVILDDGNTTITAEELLVAVGRKPKTDKLGLETVGLKPGDWLDVDNSCLVNRVDEGSGSEEWLYAVGDVNHRALLTRVGKYQRRACSTARVNRNISNNSHYGGNSAPYSSNTSNTNSANSEWFLSMEPIKYTSDGKPIYS
jgi:pyruvate/2-oxoglutarate dehydrogenase complex dihydrolipoamide dehydrogenase (E3) component